MAYFEKGTEYSIPVGNGSVLILSPHEPLRSFAVEARRVPHPDGSHGAHVFAALLCSISELLDLIFLCQIGPRHENVSPEAFNMPVLNGIKDRINALSGE
jgi:hypothetical protein